jgi:hypothetical protein
MSYDNDQNEYPLPAEGNNNRKSESLLPRFFRTETNKKFLQATLDQLTQPGVAEKLNGYYGRQISKAYNADDNYVGDVSTNRENYQFEPATIIKDNLDNVTFYKDYNDYLNQISSFGGNVQNQDILNSQEFYAWNPHIDWDKFSNFREYYWLPYGPQTVRIAGQERGVESTIAVKLINNVDNVTYSFSTDELVNNPTLILYRGQTYTFDVDAVGTPITIKTKRTLEESFNYDDGVSAQAVEKGKITFTVGNSTPEVLYYVAENDINNTGLIQIKDIEENTEIDVEKEVLGKTTYKSSQGTVLSNGMKISFAGFVTPAEYAEGDWYVEGVGSSIKLIKESSLEIPGSYADNKDVPFDTNAFDRLPFANANGYPTAKDYIVINRGSLDKNMWTRYNRWFHKDVIEASAIANGQTVSADQSARATRPIVEFEAGLKLFNFGTSNKKNVDVIDTFTKDIFSIIEGSLGYNVDGIDLVNGMRVLFTADEDIREAGKIYKIEFVRHKGRRQISLVEESDSNPLENETVLALQGEAYQGKMFYYNGTSWNLTQEKTQVNQSPLFDLFDDVGDSYADPSMYPNSTFNGTKLFSYKTGTGITDSELGFPLSYKSIQNIGDLVFNFDLLLDTFTYTDTSLATVTQGTDVCVLHNYSSRNNYNSVNGWIKANTESTQRVLRQYVANTNQTDFAVDVYDNSSILEDLNIRITVNNNLKFVNIDYEIVNIGTIATVRFNNPLNENDIVVLRTRSATTKNENGIYEIAGNLERNPLNNDVTTFTLGEVNEHVSTIVQETDEFFGTYPGPGNLRDISNAAQYGRRFLQHSGPTNLSLYHITDKSANIIKSMDFARREYAKFKRLFLQTSLGLGFDGTPKAHVDLIFKELNKNKTSNLPFYFSDMVPTGAARRLDYDAIPGNVYYALTQAFDITVPSILAVNVYLNDVQLTYDKDYTFNADGFCEITTTLESTDKITIFEFETTDGSYVPPTPTKLGLYPKFEPKLFVDSSYATPQTVIQGHDGSITAAFNDYRDDLILELEKRIYNNLKVQYNSNLIDIHSFIPGAARTTGISFDSINNTMLKDFASWLNTVGNVDYTDSSFYNREDRFTYNYSSMTSPTGTILPGYWRAIYNQAYDTDRPHTHPWEMLGFNIKPSWWETQYGPAPYTSNNDVMWSDLEKGIINEPNKAKVILKKYIRPNLTSNLPVNGQGELLSPLDSGYARDYVNALTRQPFKFGDEAPVETAWRKSSDYPFSLFKSWILNQPSKIIGLGFDRLRTIRNSAGQLVYSQTNKRLRLQDLVFPNNSAQETANRVYSSGFINFISNYLASNILVNYQNYQNNIKSITNQMAFKIGGFTDKSKFNLILDSRTPLNEGNVFIPEENYNVTLQTSSPIEIVTYSGVVVEKISSGYVIRGYDVTNPAFKYYKFDKNEKDPTVSVGGISASYIQWAERKRYTESSIVEYNNAYYRTKETHTSTGNFDTSKFARLPSLPVTGGRSAIFRSKFDKTFVQQLPYGSVLPDSQAVVDFLLGYGEHLLDQGFVFNNFNSNLEQIENWKLSSKEFLFWTLQNWDTGSLLTVSPSAQRIEFKRSDAVVDDVFDTFYDYGLVKADGTKLKSEFCNILRTNDNEFLFTVKNTADGIYAIKLPLVQKEHVVILDNETAFKDTIYDLEPGYRQERIRVLGYRTADWSGGLNIPGFIYDQAVVTEWTPWKDYAIGDVVKYKEYYYTATKKITGSEVFVSKNWYRLDEKPTPGLLTNLEYKTNQFADFYDLDTDNFDVSQQEVAQHLIGYQKRDYLANIINDDVSQYKFYQGFIADKGTKNALTKLFDALGAVDKESLNFYEEWAVRTGQYGAADGYEELEFLLDEEQFRLSPQPILLTSIIPDDVSDLIYRQLPSSVYVAPKDYNGKPFPTAYVEETPIKTAGYVREDDVNFIVTNKDEILNLDITDFDRNEYVWVTFEDQEWNVYKHIDTNYTIIDAIPDGNACTLVLDKISNFKEGDFIGIQNITDLNGFYKVLSSSVNRIDIDLGDVAFTGVEESDGSTVGILTTFVSNRVSKLEDANEYAQRDIATKEKIWIDSADDKGRWNVIQSSPAYDLDEDVINPTQSNTSFGKSIAADTTNTFVAIGSPENSEGKVHIYKRQQDGSTVYGTLQPHQTLEPITNFDNGASKFGSSVAMSPDGEYIVVGAPEATYVKSAFKDNFTLTSDYKLGAIVQYEGGLYKSRRSVKGNTDNIVFGSFDSASRWRSELYKVHNSYADFSTLAMGDLPLAVSTDHILVRAPIDSYEGSNIGDRLYLDWNDLSNAYGNNSGVNITGIDMTSPMKLITQTDHGLSDADTIIITDVPNDNIVLPDTGQFDNSNVNVPYDTIQQQGVKGLENRTYFVKVISAQQIELYEDSALLQRVNANIGFSGQPIGAAAGNLNLGDGTIQGTIRQIETPFSNITEPGIPWKTFLTSDVHTIRRKITDVFYVLDPVNIPDIPVELTLAGNLPNAVNVGDIIRQENNTVVGTVKQINNNVIQVIDISGIFKTGVDGGGNITYTSGETTVVASNTVPSAVTSIVDEGVRVTTSTGNATVVYSRNELGKLVIYANDKNGVFDATGELFINDQFKIGNYERPLHDEIDRSSVLGGFWEIALPQSVTTTTSHKDNAYGLVIKDVKNNYNPSNYSSPDATWTESAALLPYKSSIQNALDNPVQILVGVDQPFQKEVDLIRVLSHKSQGVAGVVTETDVLDSRYVVRIPKAVSDKATSAFANASTPNPYVGVFLNDLPSSDGNTPDLTNKGFGTDVFNIINQTTVPVDLWDGYIDYDVFDLTLDLEVGDIIREGETGATAEVVYYQRDGDQVRIYVKNVAGTFTFGTRYITGVAPASMFIYKQVGAVLTRIGTTESRQLADDDIGKLAVFQHTENLTIPPTLTYALNSETDEIADYEVEFITGVEYQTWIEEFKPGTSRVSLVPSTENNDWAEVNNIPINVGRDASSYTREGAFFVYKHNNETDQYDLVNGYILPNRETDRRLGKQVKLINNENFYKLAINSNESHANDAKQEVSPTGKGRIYFVINGQDEFGTYDWEQGRNKNFKGIYRNTSAYYVDQIVIYQDSFYKALTNLNNEEFNSSKWQLVSDHADFVGYVPNTSGFVFPGDDSSIVNLNTSDFGTVFDISESGSIFATIAKYSDGTSKLVIYRLTDSHFEYVTEFTAPVTSTGFGNAIAVSDNGNLIAVGASSTNTAQLKQGQIFVYKNVNGTFTLFQTLNSPNKELAEGFGSRLGFDGNQLVVTGTTSDIVLDTTFDRYQNKKPGSTYVNDPRSALQVGETVFDGGFTTYARRIEDSGLVFIYENINDSLIFGQRLTYNNFDVKDFGDNILVKNDTIMVGLPNLSVDGTLSGKVAVYIKDADSSTWSVLRSPVDPITIQKFRGSFLYNTVENKMLTRLDIIDPLQGKISGIAEQELSYKTYYDPASYNVGFANTKEKFIAWNDQNVGKLWWDLSTVKFLDYRQGKITFSQNIWNTLAKGASIDVYEWVESKILPSAWDNQADTNEGTSRGYSGQTKYGDSKYVEKDIYDKISQTFSKRYYFWVKNKKIVPSVEGRIRSGFDIANIIADPSGQKLKFVNILGSDRFILYNCNNLIENKETAINFRYWTIDNQDNNIHTEYQIITDGLETSRPKSIIEQKWFDSLVGQDLYHRPVPDPTLSVKQKYGNLNRPRQSWFVNRVEALKEVIERVNRVLESQLAIDNLNLTKLSEKDPIPTLLSGQYDEAIDTEAELRLVGTVRATQAQLEAVVVDGTVTKINIVNAGRGYRNPPNIIVTGTGEDLELQVVLNNIGAISSVNIIDGGTNYQDNITLAVRPLTALVRADSTLGGIWSLYAWDSVNRNWTVSKQQYYDVSQYWEYKDWYATGYSELTSFDYLIDDYYELNVINDSIGDIVKISNVGTGGWILLEKIINIDTPDYTTGYKTVARQNGTIKFLEKTYTSEEGKTELRKILETIRDDLFVDELANEYNQLFFASLRYVLSEQNYADWLFKTSFVKAKHNVGQLIEKTTYQNDNLPSFEEYTNEVKPYKTKIREYLSAYEKTDNTQSVVTDFELSPFFSVQLGKIVSPQVQITDGVLSGINFDETEYPQKHWIDNFTYGIDKIIVKDGGTGYTEAPSIIIVGGGGTGAKARAFIGSGSVTSVVVTDPGSGYTSTPTVTIIGTQAENSKLPSVSVILKNQKVRTFNVKQKFDRITPNFELFNLPESETFTSTGTELKLGLKYPMDLTRSNIRVFFNNVEALSSEFTYNNEEVLVSDKSYTKEVGYILLNSSKIAGTLIKVEYNKGYELLNAADRISLLYNPETGQYGKDLGQLMDGVDYGGVEVRSFEFGQDAGFDSQPWYTSAWDTYDENFDDESFVTEGLTTSFTLSKPLEEEALYNVYVNTTRVDDPNYDGSTKTYLSDDGSTILALGNPNAIMKTLTTESDEYEVTTDTSGLPVYKVNIQNVDDWEEFFASEGTPAVPAVPAVVADPEYNNGSVIDVVGDGSDFFKREVTTNGVRIMGAGTVGGQTAVPDAWLEKVARMFDLFLDPNGASINETYQRAMIQTLSGDTGTWHEGLPTIQRVARGAGADYTPNFLTDPGVISWNLTDLFDAHVQNDMVWYLNSTGAGYGDGDIDAQEVIEHVFHTLHMHGLTDDIKLYSYLSADWATGPLYAAMEEAFDGGFWDPTGYQVNADDWKTDADAFEVAAKEYLYLLNFSMFEYTELWDGGSLAPEWADSVRTQAGIQANNPLGYAFHNTYIAPVISKPSLATIRSIFGDGNTPAQDDPSLAGASGYVVDILSAGSPEIPAIPGVASDPTITIRKSTSDGSFLPSGAGFDSLIEGGNLQYGTATGLDAGDINIDGDGFVTPTTSKGPEELVPGQLHDTLDLKVYDRAAAGGSAISTRNYVATASQKIFALDILPHNIYSLLVKVNGALLVETDYVIDYNLKIVTLNTGLTLGDRVNIISMAGNGERILDIDYFTGDGNTKIFVTNVVHIDGIQSYITADGVSAKVEVFKTDSSYGELEGLVGIEFVVPPEENSHIFYALYDTNEEDIQRYSEVTVNRFVGDGSTVGYQLDPAPFTKLPLSHNIIVKVNNTILYPGYTQHWYVVPTREYPLDPSQQAPSSLSPDEVDVYLNGNKLLLLNDYNWDFANSQVVLFDNVGETGDDLEIVIPKDRDYQFSQNTRISLASVTGTFEVGETVNVGTGDSTVYSAVVKSYAAGNLVIVGTLSGLVEAVDDDNTLPVTGVTSGATSETILGVDLIEAGDSLVLTQAPNDGDTIDVYKFSRHEIQDIQMETRTNVIRSTLNVGSEDYYDAHRLGRGLVKLRSAALDTAYVWVSLNGELLTPNVDYKLVKLDTYIHIARKLETNDVVQVIHFAATPSNEKFGFRLFKDMLNRTHYKRLNKDNVYTLAEPLNITDKTIVLDNATNITQPSKELNVPGVLFVEGERIEYFTVSNNTLGQLHRGTLGTGPKDTYEAGTECMDQSNSETIPYTDQMVSLIALDDESTQVVLDWVPTKGVNEFEIFVGGRRLRKNAIPSYQFQEVDASGNVITGLIDQNSPEGDTVLQPEFTLAIDDNIATVSLVETPAENSRILVVRKLGKTWQLPGEQLRYADNSIANFIRGATTDLPK